MRRPVSVIIALFMLATCLIFPTSPTVMAAGERSAIAAPTIAASGASFAIRADGSLWAWGLNSDGQLGDGTFESRSVPFKLMDDVVHVATSIGRVSERRFSMAVKTDGSLWAWGKNRYGQLGDGTTTDRLHPVRIMDDVAFVTLGDAHALAVKTDGSLWAWGHNVSNVLGDGIAQSIFLGPDADRLQAEEYDRRTPYKILDNVVSASASNSFSMAVTEDGSLWAWGDGRFLRNLYEWEAIREINGISKNNPFIISPIKIMGDVATVATCDSVAYALKMDGSLWSWGEPEFGELGVDRLSITQSGEIIKLGPYKVMDDVVYISAQRRNAMAIKADGSLWSWGSNTFGQVGDGLVTTSSLFFSNTDNDTPKKVLDNVATVAVGNIHTLAVKTDGTLWAWGSQDSGQLGDGIFASEDHGRSREEMVGAPTTTTEVIAGRVATPKMVWDGLRVPLGTAAGGFSTGAPSGSATTQPPFTANEIKVVIDGKLMAFDVPPQIVNGRTMVPLRVIFEEMGAILAWDGNAQTVIAAKGDTVVVLTVGSVSPTVNGNFVTIDQPAIIVDGRTLAPLRFVAEAFGGTVEWDEASHTAYITK